VVCCGILPVSFVGTSTKENNWDAGFHRHVSWFKTDVSWLPIGHIFKGQNKFGLWRWEW
jgi:hypothetical protein